MVFARNTPLLFLLLLTLLPSVAYAQLTFTQDAPGAFRRAEREQRPLLIYLNRKPNVSSARRLRENAVLRHRRVVQLAKMFICVEMRPVDHARLLETWDLDARTDRYVVFAAPNRQRLHGARIGEPVEFIDHLVTARQNYGQFLWETELRGQLRSVESSSEQLPGMLERIARFQVRAADHDVAKLARRRDLPPAVRQTAWKTLARLSTRPAIEALADHARHDADARAALPDCTPIAAELLGEWLGQGPAVRDQAIYVALCKIVDVRPRRKADFWSDEDPDAIRREVGWIRAKVAREAMRLHTAE